MATVTRLTDTLLGSIVTALTAPLGVGPALGGWLAGRRERTPGRAALLGGIAGAVGAIPWVWLVYLASAGAIEPVGYHEGGVHIGINTAAPGTFVLWQEIALAALVGAVFVGFAVGGGFLAGIDEDIVGEMREDLSGAL